MGMSQIRVIPRAAQAMQRAPWYWLVGQQARVGSAANVNITASATPHAKGAWSQVVASTAEDADMIAFRLQSAVSAVNNATLVDYGVGAAGSEQVIVANMPCGGWDAAAWRLPVRIPAGSRVAVRAQSAVASRVVGTRTTLFRSRQSAYTPTSLDTIGADTATSAGTALTGASGTYTQITASTSQDYAALSVLFSLNTDDAAAISPTITLATGAAGAEVDIGTSYWSVSAAEQVANAYVDTNSAEFVTGGYIPAGTRLSVKHNIATNPGRYAVAIIGVPFA